MPLLEEMVAQRAPIRRAEAAEWEVMATTVAADLAEKAALVNTQAAVASEVQEVLGLRAAAEAADLVNRELDRYLLLKVLAQQAMEIKVLPAVTTGAVAAVVGSEAPVAIPVLRLGSVELAAMAVRVASVDL